MIVGLRTCMLVRFHLCVDVNFHYSSVETNNTRTLFKTYHFFPSYYKGQQTEVRGYKRPFATSKAMLHYWKSCWPGWQMPRLSWPPRSETLFPMIWRSWRRCWRSIWWVGLFCLVLFCLVLRALLRSLLVEWTEEHLVSGIVLSCAVLSCAVLSYAEVPVEMIINYFFKRLIAWLCNPWETTVTTPSRPSSSDTKLSYYSPSPQKKTFLLVVI